MGDKCHLNKQSIEMNFIIEFDVILKNYRYAHWIFLLYMFKRCFIKSTRLIKQLSLSAIIFINVLLR